MVHRFDVNSRNDDLKITAIADRLKTKHSHFFNIKMQDAHSVITTAAKGFVEELAKRREISMARMYEILGKDNPYPRAKVLIRDIAEVNPQGVRLIKADIDAMFADLLEPVQLKAVTTARINTEAYEAIDALLTNKCAADQKRELRELIAVCEQKIGAIDRLEARAS